MDCQWCQPRANKDEGNKSTGFEEISLEVFIQADVSVFDHKTNRIRERELSLFENTIIQENWDEIIFWTMVNDWEIIDSFLRKVRNEPAKEWYAWYNF